MDITKYNYTKQCPKCGSTHITYGAQRDYARVYGKNIFSTSNIVYFVCGRCGYVVDQFVVKPEKLKDVNEQLYKTR